MVGAAENSWLANGNGGEWGGGQPTGSQGFPVKLEDIKEEVKDLLPR
jgi:hypothetical protein